MIEGWPKKIVEAQMIKTCSIGGKQYNRIRYGEETSDWGPSDKPCHDCGVVEGQFHVPGCDWEQCPSCKGQALSCDCDYDERK